MKKILFLITILYSSFFTCKAQKIFPEKENSFTKTYSKKEYLEDVDEFVKTLTSTHPAPYEFISQEDFWNIVQRKKNLLNDKTTYSEFLWHCNEIIASLGCSHTTLGYFNQEDSVLPIGLRFPLEARLIENRLFVSDPLVNKDKLNFGTEIFAINGVPVNQIKEDVFKHIYSQAHIETYKNKLFNAYVTSYIPYALGFPKSYNIVVRGKKNAIQLKSLGNYKFKPRISPKTECQNNLCFKLFVNDKIAILTLRSFAYYNDQERADFKVFIDKSFQDIRNNEVENLIIDLRMNGGGSTFASTYLLKQVVKESFVYFAKESASDDSNETIMPSEKEFKGALFLLIDGDGQSATGHFVSILEQQKIAVLVGEELASNQFCTGAPINFKLSNTGVNFQVARRAFFTTAKDFPKNKGFLPDHYVVQPIKDFLNNVDTVLDYTIELIRRK